MLYSQNQSDTVRLIEVKIKAKAIPVSKTSVSTTLHANQLENSKGATLGDVLKGISGVHVLKTGSSISKPVIHGLHSNRILILNNGVRLEGQAWGAEHAPEIDPLIAERITVIKGAESVKYGAEAIGGIVMVMPPELFSEEKLGGSVHTIAASNGHAVTTSGMLKGGIRRFAWRLQVSHKKAGNVKSPDYHLGNTGMGEFNYSAAGGYRSDKTSYEVYYSKFSTTLGILYSAHTGTIEDIAARISIGRPLEDPGFSYVITAPKQRIFHHLAKLSARYDLGEQESLKVVYGFQHNHRKEFDFRRGDREALPITDLVLNTHTLDIDLSSERDSGFNRLLGFNGVFQVNNNIPGTLANTFIPNYDSFTGGIFVIQKWKGKLGNLEAGLRYDFKYFNAAGFRYLYNSSDTLDAEGTYYGGDNQFHNVTGSLALHRQLSSNWSYTSNFGMAWRAPSASELFSDGLHHGAGLYEIGDPNLKSEQGYKWVNALKFQQHRLAVELDVYGQFINNYIYTQPDLVYRQTVSGTYPVFRYRQTNASFFGADLTASYDVTNGLSYKINASLIRATDLGQNKFLPYIPSDRLDQSIRLDLHLKRVSDSFLQFAHGYTGRQHRYESGSDYAAPPPAYHLFHVLAGAGHETSQGKLMVQAGVDNLLKVKYKDYLNRYRYYAHDIGRNLTLRIAYKF
ncbi:MAG: TonB-dependent receptor [Bacteroidota bacterium]